MTTSRPGPVPTGAASDWAAFGRFPSRVVFHRGYLRRLTWALALVVAVSSFAHADKPAQRTFRSPQAGVAALVAAVRSNDRHALRAILGVRGDRLIDSGDPVADGKARDAFVAAYDHAHHIETAGKTQATLVIGENRWPMPIPLVKSRGAWHFDTQRGEREILDRRIGRNELSTIEVCLAIVDAEREYATEDQNGNGVLEYARRFVSTPGKRDGLYWESAPGQPPSPLGPLLAKAAKGGYASDDGLASSPYHGYYYRILTRQGRSAPGGAYDYLVRGKLIGGFAVVAYPARYGASGVMTFIVNHEGVVYQKDLGKNTARLAAAISTFNPDATWKRARVPSPVS